MKHAMLLDDAPAGLAAASREEPNAALSFGRDRSMSDVPGLYFWSRDGSARSGVYVWRSLEDAVTDLLADVLPDSEGIYFKIAKPDLSGDVEVDLEAAILARLVPVLRRYGREDR